LGGALYATEPSIGRYIDRAGYGELLPVARTKCLTPGDKLFRQLYFGLRLPDGVPLNSVDEDILGKKEFERTRSRITMLLDRGLLLRTDGSLSMSENGRLFSEEIPVFIVPDNGRLAQAVEALLHQEDSEG
jgi:coproporphyrinogen III oxidase-like Fe-S oxidoreductase